MQDLRTNVARSFTVSTHECHQKNSRGMFLSFFLIFKKNLFAPWKLLCVGTVWLFSSLCCHHSSDGMSYFFFSAAAGLIKVAKGKSEDGEPPCLQSSVIITWAVLFRRKEGETKTEYEGVWCNMKYAVTHISHYLDIFNLYFPANPTQLYFLLLLYTSLMKSLSHLVAVLLHILLC